MATLTFNGLTVDYLSDIHLEMNQSDFKFTPSDATVLVLAGDICVADYLTRSAASPYFAAAERTRNFFYQAQLRYDHILYVPGNHEHYDGRLDKTISILRKAFPLVEILDNQSTFINGVQFFGGTLWTDLSNPVHAEVARSSLNDYRLITSPKFRKLSPSETMREHMLFLTALKSLDTIPDIVISHHAPSFQSLNPVYDNDVLLNHSYASHLDNMIYDSAIPIWIHGHTHYAVDYEIGNTQIVSDPIGYPGETWVSEYRKNAKENL